MFPRVWPKFFHRREPSPPARTHPIPPVYHAAARSTRPAYPPGLIASQSRPSLTSPLSSYHMRHEGGAACAGGGGRVRCGRGSAAKLHAEARRRARRGKAARHHREGHPPSPVSLAWRRRGAGPRDGGARTSTAAEDPMAAGRRRRPRAGETSPPRPSLISPRAW